MVFILSFPFSKVFLPDFDVKDVGFWVLFFGSLYNSNHGFEKILSK